MGIAVENLKSTPRSQMISHPMMITYSSMFGSVFDLEIVNRVTMGSELNKFVTKLMAVVVVKDLPRDFQRVGPCSSF